ncbi:uncharacterized protein BDZ99DRAFT_395393 [Mytilinidion resinicola]|uniref:Heterokaryon incompatibility domain-containing protein n=1 Tax=Mytilinidion resinicola TaxID=574789 RepID=A0A6A6YBA9_9PEZI|nr:uncharacterized protein BDZ99DRAFT_395393 [Mytilinidion resinicola]KAF2806092.1 hypothetical protein BDZ99DRAFT_395393 [Mytilinidion resinicola]
MSRPPPPSPSVSSGVLGIKTYQYTPLREMEFRLVRILPARSSKIKCEIVHASIENPPDFVAISYAWGDADDTRKLILEGAIVPVSMSLHGALEALREKKEDVLVWADALCIDQQNRDERTQQVQLMTSIYTQATHVAIWLGSEADNSNVAVDLLQDVANNAQVSHYVSDLIKLSRDGPGFPAVIALFERDYWRRLWVVQEVFNAKEIWVYCGSSKLHWDVYRVASNVFWDHKANFDLTFPGSHNHGNGQRSSQNQFTYSQVLAYQGPSSIPDFSSMTSLGEDSLLEVMRACRRKLSADARDKVFGILGLLPEDIRNEFPVDYNLSVKEVYINVVDHLLHSTERLDVICESIHFPLHTSSANLPSWAPDWSHVPETASLGRSFAFSASGETDAKYKFLDERRRELEISAVYLDTISVHGISVGTLCTLADYLMAFVHWRALLLGSQERWNLGNQEAFCRTLCLDQVPQAFAESPKWLTACYHVFSSLLRERLPRMPLDEEIQRYVAPQEPVHIEPKARRQFLQEHFGARMMGRCFCLTENGRMGMGSGFMAAGDVVVVPLGCSTPILIRPEGPRGRYRFVGDVYIHGYMYGEAMKGGLKDLQKYVLH